MLIKMTDEEYNLLPALRCSDFKEFLKSPAHYKASIQKPHAKSDALRLGTAIHLAVLQPNDFDLRVLIAPECDKRTKEGKALAAIFEANLKAETIVLSKSEYDMIIGMRNSLLACNFLHAYLNPLNFIEHAARATILGVDLKIKPDLCDVDNGIIIDLKSTINAENKAYQRSAFNYGYHIQAAYYKIVLEAIYNKPFKFFNVAVEKEAPYCWNVFEYDLYCLNWARDLIYKALEYFAACKAVDVYPGYPGEIIMIELPKYLEG